MSILTTYQSQVESKSLKVVLKKTIDTVRHRYIKNLASLTTLIYFKKNLIFKSVMYFSMFCYISLAFRAEI